MLFGGCNGIIRALALRGTANGGAILMLTCGGGHAAAKIHVPKLASPIAKLARHH